MPGKRLWRLCRESFDSLSFQIKRPGSFLTYRAATIFIRGRRYLQPVSMAVGFLDPNCHRLFRVYWNSGYVLSLPTLCRGRDFFEVLGQLRCTKTLEIPTGSHVDIGKGCFFQRFCHCMGLSVGGPGCQRAMVFTTGLWHHNGGIFHDAYKFLMRPMYELCLPAQQGCWRCANGIF